MCPGRIKNRKLYIWPIPALTGHLTFHPWKLTSVGCCALAQQCLFCCMFPPIRWTYLGDLTRKLNRGRHQCGSNYFFMCQCLGLYVYVCAHVYVYIYIHSHLVKKAPVVWLYGKENEINTKSPESKVHGANMGPTWVPSAPDGPHVGPMNLAIRVSFPNAYHTVVLPQCWLQRQMCFYVKKFNH